MYTKEPIKETPEASSRLQARKLMKDSGISKYSIGEEDQPIAKLDF